MPAATSIQLPKPLLEAVDRRARALRVSRESVIVRALERELAAPEEWSNGFFEALARVDEPTRQAVDELLSVVLVKTELRRAEWTDEVSEAFGRIKASLERRGVRIEDFDAAIAAHASARAATLVTANVSHMARVVGLRVEDWSKP
jgi:predicted nucleic acid-binding protein